MDETEIISELYALPLVDFTRVRNDLAAQAKRRGRKQLAESIKQLRKPTASAWAVNLLVRHHPDEITALLAIGAQLREAQSSLAGDALRELTRQRRQAIAALGRRARAVAVQYGQKLSSASESEVEETLQAALVDPAAGYALRSGRLTAPLSYVGLGPLSVAGPAPTAETEIPKPAGTSITATWPEGESGLIWPVPDEVETPPAPVRAAPPPRPVEAAPPPVAPVPPPRPRVVSSPTSRTADEERRRREREELETARRQRELTEAREARDDAEQRAAQTATALDEAQAKAEAATARRVELDRRVDALHEELRQAEEEAMRAAKDVLEARHARDSAARADLVARRYVERARAEVERLEG